MKKIGFITLGCKVNIYESNAIKEEFQKRGYETVEAEDLCDAYIINTCSVTNMADAKSRKMIRKCIKMNPNAIICVMGCYVQTNEEAKSLDGIDILIGNGNKMIVVDKVIERLEGKTTEKYIEIKDILKEKEYEKLGVTTYDHTRAFVKIEDGCNFFCAYCIIPYARGPVRCKGVNEVIKELQDITNQGYKEVVLSGIHTGLYKDELNGETYNLSKLVKKIITEVPRLKRLRLSSIEPNEIDSEYIKMLKESDVLANHFHLPMQAGSNNVLKSMGRHYDREYFKKKIELIRETRPDIAISTDIIVGFPGETEEDFQDTINLARECGLTKLHVFPYSVRGGTKAAKMPNQVSPDVKKDRASRLIKVSEELEYEYALKFLGKKLDMIVEQKYKNYLVGHTSNFLEVLIPYDESLLKKQVNVIIEKVTKTEIFGKIEDVIE